MGYKEDLTANYNIDTTALGNSKTLLAVLEDLLTQKSKIQTERALAENGWNKRLADIAAQEHILGDELSAMGETVVTES